MRGGGFVVAAPGSAPSLPRTSGVGLDGSQEFDLRVVSRPAGQQHACSEGRGDTLCGLPVAQLHVFPDLGFPVEVASTCRVCLRAVGGAVASWGSLAS
ncbi:MAG: hypothetical protein ACTHNT_06890 [Actinomycetales bacterium]